MTRRYAWLLVAFIGMMAVVGLALTLVFTRWSGRAKPRATAALPPALPAVLGRRIKARLFYVAEDGTRLTNVERDVVYGDGTLEQARHIIEAQTAPVAEPLVSAIPPGSKLRAIFITEQGQAFVDFTGELVGAHSGGSTDELLTVYAIVNALTVNLPAIKSVQLLVDGKQVETLAGHVDLRRPIAQNLAWVQ